MKAAEVADETGLPMKQVAAAALVAKAASGDVAALKEFGDRMDGKVPQAIEHQGEDGGPIVVRIVRYTPDGDNDPV